MLAAACVLGPDLGVSGLAAYLGCVAIRVRWDPIWVSQIRRHTLGARPTRREIHICIFPTLWLQSSSSVSTQHAGQSIFVIGLDRGCLLEAPAECAFAVRSSFHGICLSLIILDWLRANALAV